MYPQGCGGSSPFDGTKISSDPKSFAALRISPAGSLFADFQTHARKEVRVDVERMRFESESPGPAREIPRSA